MGRARRRRRGRGAALLLVLAAVWAAGAAFAQWGLGRVSPALVEGAVSSYVLAQAEEALAASLEEDRAYLAVERDSAGRALSVQVDPAALNSLRAALGQRMEAALNRRARVRLPAGSLTGLALLEGRGFPVPLTLALEGAASVEFSTQFLSAGVNQSCHRVTVTVTAHARCKSRLFPGEIRAQASAVVAETVLVGETPSGVLTQQR